jgi:hypothetical protein
MWALIFEQLLDSRAMMLSGVHLSHQRRQVFAAWHKAVSTTGAF